MHQQVLDQSHETNEDSPSPKTGISATPDIHTASKQYQKRFSGVIGKWILEKQLRSVLKLLSNPSIHTVLDVGGGHAQIAPYLSDNQYEVTVTGSSQECRQQLESYINDGRIQFLCSNMTAIPVPDESFDAVVCLRQLCHIDDVDALIRECCRISRHIVIADYPSQKSLNIFSRLFFPMKRWLEKNTRTFSVFKDRDVKAHLRKHSFHVRSQIRQFFLPVSFYRLIGILTLAIFSECLFEHVKLTENYGSPVIFSAEREESKEEIQVSKELAETQLS